MQRRLFLLFLLLSFLPAIALLLVNWQTSQRFLDYLDGPGLSSAMESALDLARETLEREKAMTQAGAEVAVATLAAGLDPPLAPGTAWRRLDASAQAGADSLLVLLAEAAPPPKGLVERRGVGAGSVLLARRPGRIAPALPAIPGSSPDRLPGGRGSGRRQAPAAAWLLS